MLRWMLRVDSWLDVAPLENMEEDHSFLFLKKNLMKMFFFFLKILEILNFLKELKILTSEFFFFFFKFESNLKSMSPMNPSPKAFFFSFFENSFLKNRNLEFFEGIENFDWWLLLLLFFESDLRSTSTIALVPRPFFKISYFFFLFFFWKTYPLNENDYGWKLMRIAG